VNPKNFLFDPNGLEIDDCMGVAIEKYVSIHKIAKGIASGKYHNVDIASLYEDDSLEPTQESKNYEDDKVKLLTYYGLVPREYLDTGEEIEEILPENEAIEDYTDMVEAIVVIANGSLLLKAEESPYMMKDRPVISYQADTVPNRLVGRGTAEKAFNMQMSVDGSMRSHMDSLALTVARAAESCAATPAELVGTYTELGRELDFDWLISRLSELPHVSHWQAMERDSGQLRAQVPQRYVNGPDGAQYGAGSPGK
jgi:hypothetical protein